MALLHLGRVGKLFHSTICCVFDSLPQDNKKIRKQDREFFNTP